MTPVGQTTVRGRLCTSCHTMRPARVFTWTVGDKFYCSELCARRMQLPRPRGSRE